MLALFFSTLLSMAIAEAPQLCGDDGETIQASGIYNVAIIGNTRLANKTTDPAARRVGPSKGITKFLLTDIGGTSPECVAFVGDMVRSGSKKEWKTFQESQLPLVSQSGVLPVVGDAEASRDEKYTQLSSVFPAIGNDIGYNRVGSWYAYDVQSDGVTWRFMVLDANKNALKSRWKEQLSWIDEAVQGEYEGLFLFLHEPLYNLAGAQPKMNAQNAPRELIEYVEDSLGMMKLRAVFFGGGHANQVILPNGKYGTAFVGAGGGGAPAEDLYLWQTGADFGLDRIALEPSFVEVLLFELDRWHARTPVSTLTIEKAFNKGTFEGYPGLISGSDFPIQGWWELKLKGRQSVIVYHHYFQNQEMKKLYKLEYTEKNGWRAVKQSQK